jgi:2'-5' RNA ligase
MKDIIKKLVRTKLLTEIEGRKYSYGCVMLYLPESTKSFMNKIQSEIDDDDVYTEDGFGREDSYHITLLYGIHSDVEDSDIEKTVKNFTNPEITLNKLSSFNNPSYDVLKFEVTNKELNKMNEILKEFPYTSDYDDYKAHVTVAYLKPGTAEKYIKRLPENESLTVRPDKIVYSKADGEKIEYPFEDGK